MKQLICFIAFIFISTFLLSQPCVLQDLPTEVTIENKFRQSIIGSLTNLGFDLEKPNTVYNDSGEDLFELGFARSIWAGARDAQGEIRTAVEEYGFDNDFKPGPIWREFDDEDALCTAYLRIWKVTKSEMEELKAAQQDGSLTINNIPTDILEWPAQGNPHLGEFAPDFELAPYFDNNQDGRYDPFKGDYPIVLKENPDLLPTQFRFYVFNDLTTHTATETEALGLEFQMMDYLFDCPAQPDINQSIFTRAKLFYKGEQELEDFKLGLWNDYDFGCLEDDMMGCIPDHNTVYAYNENGIDRIDCVPWTKPIPDNLSSVNSLVLLNQSLRTHMVYYNPSIGLPNPNTTDPRIAAHYYDYLDGKWPGSTPATIGGDGFNPGSGNVTSHLFPDYPSIQNGWSMQTELIQGLDARTLSTYYSAPRISAGEVVSLDFVDHVLLSEEKLGLDIFEDHLPAVNELQTTYQKFLDGSFDCQPSHTGQLSKTLLEMVLSPNPATEKITIQFSEKTSGISKIYSAAGSCISETRLESTTEISHDISHMPSGAYFVSILDEKGNFTVRTFMKQ